MPEPFFPLRVDIFPETGFLGPEHLTNVSARHLSAMRGMYQDVGAAEAMVAAGDPLLYQVYQAAIPDAIPHLLFGTTVIYPGKVGDEYFMTKGHYHEIEHTAEVYFCLRGRGYILQENRAGQVGGHIVHPGHAVYIPPPGANPSVNLGDEEFVFFYVYPAGSGHDYEAFEGLGFRHILVERDGEPACLPNPRLA